MPYGLAGLAGFLVFAPLTFIWHTVLFTSFYIGPTFAVKSADSLSPGHLVAGYLLLMLGMGYFVPATIKGTGRIAKGAILGAIFVSVVIGVHSLSLMGLFPGSDPLSLYAMDTLWAPICGAPAGAVMMLVYDKLAKPAAQPAAKPV